jgi:hypothetical protein
MEMGWDGNWGTGFGRLGLGFGIVSSIGINN